MFIQASESGYVIQLEAKSVTQIVAGKKLEGPLGNEFWLNACPTILYRIPLFLFFTLIFRSGRM